MTLFGNKKNTIKHSAVRTEQKTKTKRVVHMHIATQHNGTEHEIIHTPWFSEKALIATEKNVYVFAVPSYATKATIAGAIKAIYNIVPKYIRIVNLPAKRKALRARRGMGTRNKRRKAYIYLNIGDSIKLA